MKVFARRLKKLRVANKLTQDELARKIGLSPKMISFYELGERTPSRESITNLADYFHVNIDYLLGRTEDPLDYEDPDLQTDIAGPQYEYFLEEHNYDIKKATKAYLEFKEVEKKDAMRDYEDVPAIINPDIRLIARAGKKLSAEQAEQLRKYAEFMFPEAFYEE